MQSQVKGDEDHEGRESGRGDGGGEAGERPCHAAGSAPGENEDDLVLKIDFFFEIGEGGTFEGFFGVGSGGDLGRRVPFSKNVGGRANAGQLYERGSGGGLIFVSGGCGRREDKEDGARKHASEFDVHRYVCVRVFG